MMPPPSVGPKLRHIPGDASLTQGSRLDPAQSQELAGHAELALIREFFELLAEWQEKMNRGN